MSGSIQHALGLLGQAASAERRPVRPCSDPEATLREYDAIARKAHGLRMEAAVYAIAVLIERLDNPTVHVTKPPGES